MYVHSLYHAHIPYTYQYIYICIYIYYIHTLQPLVVLQQLHRPPARRDGSPLLFTMSLMDFVVSRELGCSRATLVSNARVTSPPPPSPSHTHAHTYYIHIVVCRTFVTRAHRSHTVFKHYNVILYYIR